MASVLSHRVRNHQLLCHMHTYNSWKRNPVMLRPRWQVAHLVLGRIYSFGAIRSKTRLTLINPSLAIIDKRKLQSEIKRNFHEIGRSFRYDVSRALGVALRDRRLRWPSGNAKKMQGT